MFDFFKKFGITRVFEDAAAAGDANNANASGGGDANKGGGGGGDGEGDTANKDNKSAEDKTQTHEIKVNGETRHVTLDEMKTLAQKSAAVDKGFEDIAAQRKSNEDAIRMKELVDRIGSSETPTEADTKELAVMLGVDSENMSQYLEGDPASGDDPKQDKIDPKALAEALGIEPAEIVSRLDYSHRRHVADAKKDIRENSDLEVDKDEFFGKIKIGKGGDDIIGTVKDLVAEDVLRKIQDGTPNGADLVAASIQKVRAHLVKMGIPGKPDEHLLTLGLIPGGGLPSEVTSETPIDRVESGKEGAEDNFVSRYMQKGLKMIRDNAIKQK